MGLNFQEIVSAFLVLFAIIDITGSIPLIISLRDKGNIIKPLKVSVVSAVVLITFLFLGEGLLSIFSVDVHSFAVAGAIVIFVYGFEMTLGVEIVKDKGPKEVASIVPLVFPLIAGAGSMTTLISMRAEYEIINIIIAILMNTTFVYFILKYVDKFEKLIGPSAIYVLQKVFGIILIAISVKLFASNISTLIN